MTTGSGPCSPSGTPQAQRLVPLLAAYDVTTLVSSSSLRCVETVAAYAETTGFPLRLTAGLSEEDATKASVDEIVEDLLDAGGGSVLCTHRPVLPAGLEALGLEKLRLEPGEMLVVHHRKGQFVAIERHLPDARGRPAAADGSVHVMSASVTPGVAERASRVHPSFTVAPPRRTPRAP